MRFRYKSFRYKFFRFHYKQEGLLKKAIIQGLPQKYSKKPVVIYHLVVTDSIDETVMESLKHKNATQRSLLNALKRDLKSRVN